MGDADGEAVLAQAAQSFLHLLAVANDGATGVVVGGVCGCQG